MRRLGFILHFASGFQVLLLAVALIAGLDSRAADAGNAAHLVPAGGPPSGGPNPLWRGPYLQSCSSTSIVICWSTSVETAGRVLFGFRPDELELLESSPAPAVHHAVTLTGLQPNTRYYYAVGTATKIIGGGPDYRFFTAPTNAQPTRIWAIGDAGTASTNQSAVRDAFLDLAGDGFANVWLMLGDNAYECGTDEEYQAAVFEMYPSILRRVVVWPTIGNHDAGCEVNPDLSAYLNIFHLPTRGEAGGVPSGTEKYYSFDHGNIHFVCLDSHSSSRRAGEAMLTWLEQDLAATEKDWIIAYFHHPPYSFGTHDSDKDLVLIEMREEVVPILESYGVDLVLGGHSHVYERSFLLNGYYGFSADFNPAYVLDAGFGREGEDGPYEKPAGGIGAGQGTVYVVCGFSGNGGSFTLRPHPAMRVGLDGFGSMILDVDGLRMRARLLMKEGAIADYFTIQKGLPPTSLRPRLTLERTGNTGTLRWPTSLRPFRLESSDQPASLSGWHRVQQAPARVGREESVTIDLLRPNEIFRLRAD